MLYIIVQALLCFSSFVQLVTIPFQDNCQSIRLLVQVDDTDLSETWRCPLAEVRCLPCRREIM